MSLSDIQWDFLQDVAALIAFAKSSGFKLTGGELRRPLDMQKLYVERGLSKTMNSDHLIALAIDFNIFVDGEYIGGNKNAKKKAEPLGTFWKELHEKNYWGGDWKTFVDVPHFGRKR